MMFELMQAFDLIDADDDVRAVIVTGPRARLLRRRRPVERRRHVQLRRSGASRPQKLGITGKRRRSTATAAGS